MLGKFKLDGSLRAVLPCALFRAEGGAGRSSPVGLLQSDRARQRGSARWRCATADGSASPYYLVGELVFDDMEALQAGATSPEGHAAAANFTELAPPGSLLLVMEDMVDRTLSRYTRIRSVSSPPGGKRRSAKMG